MDHKTEKSLLIQTRLGFKDCVERSNFLKGLKVVTMNWCARGTKNIVVKGLKEKSV
jgi:hypothetical protein